MHVLPDVPVELDPAYIAAEEPIEEAVRPRQPHVGEWVQGYEPVGNGPGHIRSYWVGGPFLAQVLEVRDGAYDGDINDPKLGGCLVRPWQRSRMAFGQPIFMPWCCVLSRTAANAYSLTGEWPASWPVEA